VGRATVAEGPAATAVARGKWRGFCPAAAARHTPSAATHTDGRAGGSNVALSQVIILRREDLEHIQKHAVSRKIRAEPG